MQILLVENEKLTLDGIYRTLPWSELGVEQVHRAMNGVQGVQIAKEIMPEIIITDIKMPRLDGIGMARCIREFLPQSTIIFMSAYTEKEMFINAIEVLAFGWLEKPLNIADMAEMIRRAVRVQKKRIQQEENLDQLRGDYEDSLSVIKSICHDNAVFANSIPATLRRQIEPGSEEQMNPLIQQLCSYVAESYTDPDICPLQRFFYTFPDFRPSSLVHLPDPKQRHHRVGIKLEIQVVMVLNKFISCDFDIFTKIRSVQYIFQIGNTACIS